jgi:hypothetical protein
MIPRFHRKIQALDEGIRNSPLVQLSVKICKALSSRNYVRFFRIVRDPALPFLAGAILLRYFPQIRTQGLRLLVNALTPTKKTTVKVRRYPGLRIPSKPLTSELMETLDLFFRGLATISSKRILQKNE